MHQKLGNTLSVMVFFEVIQHGQNTAK